MSLNPQGKESAKVNDADTEQAQHIAELLEIAGATKINAAVELRVAAMRVKEKAKITSLASAARRSSATAARGEHKAMGGGIATVVAASKLKARAKVLFFRLLLEPVISFLFSFQLDAACACSAQTPGISRVCTDGGCSCASRQATKEKVEAAAAVNLVSNMSLGEMQGPKAGPLRWVFRRRLLLDIWEWNSFQSEAWQGAFMSALAKRVNREFSDEKVCMLYFHRGGLYWHLAHAPS